MQVKLTVAAQQGFILLTVAVNYVTIQLTVAIFACTFIHALGRPPAVPVASSSFLLLEQPHLIFFAPPATGSSLLLPSVTVYSFVHIMEQATMARSLAFCAWESHFSQFTNLALLATCQNGRAVELANCWQEQLFCCLAPKSLECNSIY